MGSHIIHTLWKVEPLPPNELIELHSQIHNPRVPHLMPEPFNQICSVKSSSLIIYFIQCLFGVFPFTEFIVLPVLDVDRGVLVENCGFDERGVPAAVAEYPAEGLLVLEAHSEGHDCTLEESANA